MLLSSKVLFSAAVASSLGLVQAASWGVAEATLSVQGRGAEGGFKEKLVPSKPLSKAVTLASSDTLKIVVTAQEDGKDRRPHQAFLYIKDVDSGLEVSYGMSVKESGKGKVELTQKDIPSQLLRPLRPLQAGVIVASFGGSAGYQQHLFDVDLKLDQSAVPAAPDKPMRYGKLEEIHHIFRDGPTNPPKIISIVFTGAVFATLPVLLGTWLALGANVNHASRALASAPIAHALFFSAIIAMEAIFSLYYTSWNLFQTLPAAAAVGAVAFFSGSRALSEVQGRRLAGTR